MIDVSTFNLIYVRKEDSRKFLVRQITKLNFVALDSVTGQVLRLSQHMLRTFYRPMKEVNKHNGRRYFMNYGRRRIA